MAIGRIPEGKGGSRADERERAEALAIRALGYLAGDPVLLPRFLSLTGIEVSDIRRAAAEPGFLAGVLRFLLDHEPTLNSFCEETATPPEAVGRALRALPGGDDGQTGFP